MAFLFQINENIKLYIIHKNILFKDYQLFLHQRINHPNTQNKRQH